MPCKHVYQQIARFKVREGLEYEVESCIKCDEERCLRLKREVVNLKPALEGVAPYLLSAYHDLSYCLINYRVKDYKRVVSDPHALEVAMEAFVAAYVLDSEKAEE